MYKASSYAAQGASTPVFIFMAAIRLMTAEYEMIIRVANIFIIFWR